MKGLNVIKTNSLMIAAVVVLALTLAFSVYYKTQLAQSERIIAELELDQSCDLHKEACSLNLPDGGNVRFSIEPRPIPLLETINLKVDVGSIDAKAVTVDFQGTTMNMGLNRFGLKSTGAGSFQGNGALPVCIRNSMEWKAQVMIKTADGVYIAPYTFVTQK